MGTNQTNVAKIAQEVQNNILQASSQQCISNCQNISNGETVIFNGVNIDGNVDFNQSCSATASCLMKQQLQSQVQNIMSALASQTEEIEKGILSFNISNEVNSTDINQNITNSITQVIQSSCQANSTNISNDELVVLENTNVGGNFSLGQDGSAVANCTMNNLARQVTFNQTSAKANQSQKVESIFAIIAIAIIIIVVVGAIIVFITLRPRGKSKSSSSGKTSSKPNGKGKSSFLKFIEDNPELLA